MGGCPPRSFWKPPRSRSSMLAPSSFIPRQTIIQKEPPIFPLQIAVSPAVDPVVPPNPRVQVARGDPALLRVAYPLLAVHRCLERAFAQTLILPLFPEKEIAVIEAKGSGIPRPTTPKKALRVKRLEEKPPEKPSSLSPSPNI